MGDRPRKRCTKCSETKLLVDFCLDRSRKDGFNNHCRACRSDFKKKYIESLVGYGLPVSREVRGRVPKARFFCRDCGVALQNRGNFYDFCSKCVPVLKTNIGYCRFCGRVVNILGGRLICQSKECQRKWKLERQHKVKDICKAYKDRLRKKGCCVCSYSACLTALEFHHIGQDKGCTISRVNTLQRLRAEIEKHPVVVLCANCHRELHAGMINEVGLVLKKLVNFSEQIAILG